MLKQSFQLEPRLYGVLREVNAILMVEHRTSKQQLALEQELWQRCAPYANTALPLHTLCEQVECFLFRIVRLRGPTRDALGQQSGGAQCTALVIARKISGGSRSPADSQTRIALFSCFGTWAAQRLNPFLQCLALLSLQNPLG